MIARLLMPSCDYRIARSLLYRLFKAAPLILLQLILSNFVFCASAPPAQSFARTDSFAATSIFDPIHKVVYASVPGLNQVVVISSALHTIINRIPVPGAFSMDLSPDGSRLVVGSGNSTLGGAEVPVLTLVDTSTWRIIGVYSVPSLDTASPLTIPFSLVWTSNGTVLIAAQEPKALFFGLIQWDPVTNSFRSRPLPDPNVQAQAIVRSGDHSKVLINDSSTNGANLVLYDSNVDGFVATNSVDGLYTALNPDGTLVAVEGVNRLFNRLQRTGRGE